MSFILGFISAMLLFIGLWQIEMMWLHKGWGFEYFHLPFRLKIPWWAARDLWYGCIIVGYVILLGLLIF